MKIKVGELEKTYRGMNEEDFENVDWLDLTEEAKLVYERELQRRLPSQWHDVIEERKELLAIQRWIGQLSLCCQQRGALAGRITLSEFSRWTLESLRSSS